MEERTFIEPAAGDPVHVFKLPPVSVQGLILEALKDGFDGELTGYDGELAVD
jgi:hypothetical protein